MVSTGATVPRAARISSALARAVFGLLGALVIASVAPTSAHAAHVFIDPGHGGPYSNANLPSLGIYEKNVNLAISLALRDQLIARGHTVTMARTTDRAVGLTDIPTWKYTSTTDRWAYAKDGIVRYSDGVPRDDLQARCNLANAAGADIFISLHNNGAESTAADGFENFASDQDILGSRLANIVQSEVIAATPLDDRGARNTDFYVLKWSHMPAILIEGGFLTNYSDRAYLTSYTGRTTLARAVATAVDKFLATDPYKPVWPRIAGADRFETATALSREGWPTTSARVILATGAKWPDALASAPLSRKLDAPLLLTRPDSLSPATAAELQRLAPDEIVILGGELAVSSAVATAAVEACGPKTPTVRRIAGTNRYQTAALIAAQVGVPADGRVAIVNGERHADAVSIAPYAGKSLIPILLVQQSWIPTETTVARKQFGTAWKSTIVVGGTGAVNDAVAGLCPTPSRVAGANRYATNLAIIDRFYPGVQRFYVCNGQIAPDSLTAGALGAKSGRTTLLVAPRTINDYTRLWIENNESRIAAWTMVGGSAAVPYLQDWILRKALL